MLKITDRGRAYLPFSRILTAIETVPLAMLTVLFAGCAGPTMPERGVLPEKVRNDIYERAQLEFADTVLIKPRSVDPDGVASRLAPLILQETPGESFAPAPPQFYSQPGEDMSSAFLTNQALLCFVGAASIHGHLHQQATYLWFYPDETLASTNMLSHQGIRITMDSAGQPAIWEVLADPTGADLIFIAESLESAARDVFGKPVRGRRFSIERALAEAPRTVVARVIEDGPMPMGPIVYLRHATHEISTLVCRCMPAQAAKLSGQRLYELVEAPTEGEFAAVVQFHRSGHGGLDGVTGSWSFPQSAEQRLRLPPDF